MPQITLEESDQENLAELEEADETESAERGDDVAEIQTTTVENKPSGSQNPTQHSGM